MPVQSQALEQQRVITSATPKIADIIFFERRDGRLPKNQVGSEFRKYGGNHPNPALFPNHKLAFIEPDDNKGHEKWWFVADREGQDVYNYEASFPNDGLTEFPRYKRTYVEPRASYVPLEKGVPDPTFPDAKLIFEEQSRTGERQLDNLYVVVTREYEHVPDIHQQNLFNVDTSYPYAGLTEFPRYTRTYTMPRQDYVAQEKGTADPVHSGAKLVSEDQSQVSDPKLRSLYLKVTRVYDSVATEAQQAGYNAQVTYPYAGLPDFRRVTRQFMLPREGYTKPALHSADPEFAGALLISETQASLGDSSLDSIYVQVTRTYDEVPSESAQDAYNGKTTRPYAAIADFIRVTRSYVVPRADHVAATIGTPDTVNPEAKLIDEQVAQFEGSELQSRYIRVTRVFDYLPDQVTQETYNLEESYPYRGLKEFPRYTRRYVFLRSEYAALAKGLVDPVHTEAVLVSQQMRRFSDPSLDSRYVQSVRSYDLIPDLANTDHAALLKGLGYKVLRPHGDDAYPQLIWSFPLLRTDFVATPEYSVCPIVGYGPGLEDPRLLLTDEKMEDDAQSPVSVIVTRVYTRLPGPDLESVVADSPSDVPSKFILSRTTTVATQDQNRDASVSIVGGNITDSAGAVLRSKAGPAGRSSIVHAKENTTIQVEIADALTSWEFDQETGQIFPVTQELVLTGTDEGSPIGVDGIYAEIAPYNAYWDIKTTRKATGLLDERSYQSFIHYTWPAVLLELNFYAILKESNGSDYVDRYGYDVDIRSTYAGPCLANVTEGWSSEPPAGLGNGPTIMQPKEANWSFILSKGQIQPTLHAAFSVYESTGTTDPRYPYQIMQKNFEATNFIDWPAEITASFVVTPWRGGYRWKRVRVTSPITT